MMWRLRGIVLVAASFALTVTTSAETNEDRVAKILSGTIASCWSILPSENRKPLTFSVRFKLKPDGSVDGRPEPVKAPMSEYEQQLVNGGIRAILKCSPYKRLPTSGLPYADWQDIIVRFDPNDFAL